MRDFSISDLVSRAWDLACKFWPVLALLFLFATLFSSVGSGSNISPDLFENPDPQMLIEMLSAQMWSFWNVLSIFVGMYISYITFRCARRAYNTGILYEKIGDIFKVDFNHLAFFFGIQIVYGVAISAGLMCCLIPGIFLGVRSMFTPLIAATEDVKFSEAFKKSWEMTKGHFWKLFGLALVCLGIGILGICACYVGVFFAQVINLFITILAYEELKPSTPPYEEIVEPIEEVTVEDSTNPDSPTDNYSKQE